jgi:Tol biopolymer transport system component
LRLRLRKEKRRTTSELQTEWQRRLGLRKKMNQLCRAVPSFLVLAALVSMVASHAWSADRFVFVKDGTVWIAATDGTEVRQLTSSGEDAEPALSPDGQRVVYHSGHNERTGYGQLYLLPTGGGSPKQLQFTGIEGAEHASFSPDGKSLLFVALSNSRLRGSGDAALTYATMSIVVVDLATGRVRTVIKTPNVMLDAGYVYSAPSFSSDGKLIAYQSSGSDVSGGFAVITLEGKSLFRFPRKVSDPTPFWRPRFSADGKNILCYSPATSEAGSDIIYLVNLATGTRKKVTEGANGTFVEGGKAIIFERWLNKWADGARPALFYLDMTKGAQPKRLMMDASQPSG